MKLKDIIGSVASKLAALALATVTIGSAWAEEINVIDVPELTVTTLDPADDSLDWRGQLTPVNVALHYELSADVLAAHQEEFAAIANWKIDWVLTSSEDLTLVNPGTALPSGMTFEQVDASSEGGCISGKTSEDVEWVYAPLGDSPFTLEANTGYRVLGQISPGGIIGAMSLEARGFVENKGFGCSLYLTTAYRMAHPNVVITLEPILYNPDDPSKSYSLGEAKRFTFGLPDAPEAVVTKNTAYNKEVNLVPVNNILGGGYQYGTVTPNVAYTFEAKDTSEEASSGKYASWKCDYVVSMDADTDAYSIGLFGQYGWGAVAFPSPVDAKAGEKIPLLMSVTKNGWNYSDIVKMVGSFTCGAINFSEENRGKTITVSLVMWNEDNPVYNSYENPYVVEEIKYKFETVTPLFASVSQGAPAVPVVYRKNTADEYGFSVDEDGYPVVDENNVLVIKSFDAGEPHFAMVADNSIAKTSDANYSTADEAIATVEDNKEITVNVSTSIGSEAAPAGSTVTTTTGTAVTAGTGSTAETTVTPKTVTITSGTGSEQTGKTVEAYVVSQGSGDGKKFSVVTDVSKDETIVSTGKTVVSDFVKPAAVIANAVASENLAADKVSSMVLSLAKTEAESSEPGLNTALVTAIGAADKAFEVHPVATITTTTEEGTTATTSYAVANSELAEDASFTFTLDFGVENAGKLVTLTHYASDGVIKQHNGKDSWTESLDANGLATVTLSEFSYLLGTLSEETLPVVATVEAGGETTNFWDLHKALEAGKAAGSVVTLLADVDLAGVAWEPVGTQSEPFRGTFDGNSKTISNLYIPYTYPNVVQNVGLIGTMSDATIKDLEIHNANVTGSGYVGALVGNGDTGSISGVTVSGNIKVLGYQYVGGLVGHGYARIEDCAVCGDGAATSFVRKAASSEINGSGTNGWVGGLKGFLPEGCIIDGCTVADISVLSNDDTVGGVTGMLHYGSTISDCTVSDVVVRADDDDDGYNGIIAGARYKGQPSSILDCTIENVTATAGNDTLTTLIGSATVATSTSGYGSPVAISSSTDGKVSYVYYDTLNSVVAAADADDVIVVLVSPSGLVAPEGWDFKTENNVTTLVRAVAQIGANKYETLAEAIAAANDDETVKMLADVSLDVYVRAQNKKITLDLNGKTVSCGAVTTLLVNGAQLTIDDTSESGEGKVVSTSDNTSYGVVFVQNAGAIIVNAGMIVSDCAARPAIRNANAAGCSIAVAGGAVKNTAGKFAICAHGDADVTITDGAVSAPNWTIMNYGTGDIAVGGGSVSATSGNGAIENISTGNVIISGEALISASANQAIRNDVAGKVTVAGGTVSANGNHGIYNAGTGAVEISGGKLSALYYAVNNQSTGPITISGGDINAVGFAILNYSDGEVTISDGNIESVAHAVLNAANGTVTITGGSMLCKPMTGYEGLGEAAIYNGNYWGQTSDPPTTGVINISGGTIRADYRGAIENHTGTLNISGGEISSLNNAIMNFNPGGAVTISGSASIIADDDPNGSGCAIYSSSGNSDSVDITGGKISGLLGLGSGTYSITGGIFSVEPTKGVAEGYSVVDNPDTATKDDYPYTVVSLYEAQIVREGVVQQKGTLAAMIAAATSGDTIQLLKDVSLTERLFVNAGAEPAYAGSNNRYATTSEDKAITLDLNGKNITSASNIALAGGSLNITGTGTISTTGSGLAPIEVRGTGDLAKKRTLTIGEDVTLDSTSRSYGLNVFGSNDAQKNIIDVTVNGTVNGTLFVLGNLTNAENEINIVVNGTVIAPNGTGTDVNVGIALNGNANVTVNNGATVSGDSGIEVRAGNLTVNGGTISATSQEYSYKPNGSGSTTKGAAIAVAQHGTLLPTTATLNGGTLSGTKQIAVTDVNGNMDAVTVKATQGYTQSSAIPDGYKWVATEAEGEYKLVPKSYVAQIVETGTKFETLAEAIGAAQAGDTVQLLKDVAMSEHAYADKAVGIDGNGKSITFDKSTLTPHGYNDFPIWIEAAPGDPAIAISGVTISGTGGNYTFGIQNAQSTIENVTINANGSEGLCIDGGSSTLAAVTIHNTGVNVNANKDWHNTALSLASKADVTVNGGEYTSENGYAIYLLTTGGKFTINDGTFAGKIRAGVNDGSITAEILIRGGKFDVPEFKTDGATAKIVISGGVFKTSPGAAYIAPGYEVVANTDDATKDAYPYTVVSAYEAQIVRGGVVVTPKGTLAEMITAAQVGDTVQLLKDCETGTAYTHANPLVFNTANATLDLNGKTLTITYNMSLVFRCSNGEVKNGTIVPGVTDLNVSGEWCRYGLTIDSCTGVKVTDVTSTTGIAVGGDPDDNYTPGAGPATGVVFEGCTVTGRSTRYAVFAQNQSTATIKDGTYNANTANEGVLYANFGSNDGGAGILKVTGGSFMGAITQNNAGAIVISGGIFSKRPVAGLLATGYEVVDNTDAETKVEYPYMVDRKLEVIAAADGTVELSKAVDSGYTFQKQVGNGEWKAVTAMHVVESESELPASGATQTYKFKFVDGATDIPVGSTVGILHVADSQTNKTTIIGVPWFALGEKITVDSLVYLGNREEGDTITAYNATNGKYYSWTLAKGEGDALVWTKDSTVKEGEESNTGDTPEASTFELQRGQGLFLTRKTPTKPIYLVGRADGTATATTTLASGTEKNPTWSLLAAPSTTALNLNSSAFKSDTYAKDTIMLPTTGAGVKIPITYENGNWGGPTSVAFKIGDKTYHYTTRTENVTIPAGTGFWFLNKSAEKDVEWTSGGTN